ncbi:hypothetical protein TREES_T100011715 [Tupaia chinensis]|uniref:Uncharacterized protein n=1 Tax=Tupaia chinensis TaxID=246437 RepID=L9L1C9_TUPCH|nr:hypothetical protein TREES_T100011715 [Tupaia chinensis]
MFIMYSSVDTSEEQKQQELPADTDRNELEGVHVVFRTRDTARELAKGYRCRDDLQHGQDCKSGSYCHRTGGIAAALHGSTPSSNSTEKPARSEGCPYCGS